MASAMAMSGAAGPAMTVLCVGAQPKLIVRNTFLRAPSSSGFHRRSVKPVSEKPFLVGRALAPCTGLGSLRFHRHAQPRLNVEASAYEAETPDIFPSKGSNTSVPLTDESAKKSSAKTLKIGIYFATWWSLNVVFNIYNKKVLNAFPYPWLTSTLSLAAGSLIMLVSWLTRIAEKPEIDLDFWKVLAPVSESGLKPVKVEMQCNEMNWLVEGLNLPAVLLKLANLHVKTCFVQMAFNWQLRTEGMLLHLLVGPRDKQK